MPTSACGRRSRGTWECCEPSAVFCDGRNSHCAHSYAASRPFWILHVLCVDSRVSSSPLFLRAVSVGIDESDSGHTKVISGSGGSKPGREVCPGLRSRKRMRWCKRDPYRLARFPGGMPISLRRSGQRSWSPSRTAKETLLESLWTISPTNLKRSSIAVTCR